MNFKSLILDGEKATSFKLVQKHASGKFVKAEDGTIFSVTNLKNATNDGIIEWTGEADFKVLKGNRFENDANVTIFTMKAGMKTVDF